MYAIGYAVAPALEGPYTKPLSGPWLATSYTDNGQVQLAGRDRALAPPLAPFQWRQDVPHVDIIASVEVLPTQPG